MGCMNWLRVIPWVTLIVVELALASTSGSDAFRWDLAACATGGLGAFLYLRRRAASVAALLEDEIDSGRLIWAAQVRQDRFGGTMRLYPDLEFKYLPDGWSERHGAIPKTWAPGTRLTFTSTRRDITGIRIHSVVLTPASGSPVAFDTYTAVGVLPATCVI